MKPLFLVRMSAIGDTLLATRTHRQAREKGYAPFLVTHASNNALIHCMPHLQGACLFSDSEPVFFRRNQDTQLLESVDQQFFFESMKKTWLNTRPSTTDDSSGVVMNAVDLQATRRSRKALTQLKRMSAQYGFGIHTSSVRKLTLLRILLVMWGFLARTQWSGRRPPAWLAKHLKPVRLLQKEAIAKLPSLPIDSDSIVQKSALVAPIPQRTSAPAAKSDEPYVVMLLGSSQRLKSWPASSYRRLCELVLNRTNLKIILSGGADDNATGEYLAFSDRTRIINLTGKTSLSETLSWIANATYVVTGDSFGGHAADLLETPASVLFGATHPLLGFAPEGPHISVHHTSLSCSPCSRHGQGHCRFQNMRCLSGINAEDVFAKIEAAWVRQRQSIDAKPTRD